MPTNAAEFKRKTHVEKLNIYLINNKMHNSRIKWLKYLHRMENDKTLKVKFEYTAKGYGDMGILLKDAVKLKQA
jgi:hypothetical protein